MSLLQYKSSWYSQIWKIKFERKDMAFTSTRNFKVHFHWARDEILPWFYVMILWVILLVLFWTMCDSVKGPCDIKLFQISTTYVFWFSRYRPFNLMLATDSTLVIVFINFLWEVYQGQWQEIAPHSIYWMWLLIPALGTCFWHTDPYIFSDFTYS